MAEARIRPETHEEHIIYWGIVLTWAFWSLGALYLVAPALGWLLIGLSLGRHLGFGDGLPRLRDGLTWDCVVWIAAMLVMRVAKPSPGFAPAE